MSSFNVVATPTALPGQCRVCGSANKEWYLDTGYSEEFVGAIYYCNECIAHIARVCGYLTPEDAEKLKARTQEAEHEVYQLRKLLDKMGKDLDVIRGISLSAAAGLASLRPDDPVLEALEPPVAGASGGEDSLGAGEGTSPESSDDEGVDELRSDASSDDSEFRLSI